MKKLKLNKRGADLYALVDDDVYSELLPFKWFADKDKNGNFYVWRHDYSNGWQNPKKLYLHRYLMAPTRGVTVDHKDHNTLNNRRGNLRLATYAQQNLNQKRRTDNTSGHRGVYWESRRTCWRVCINFKGKQVHVGQFKAKDVAIAAYKQKAVELYGEFATT